MSKNNFKPGEKAPISGQYEMGGPRGGKRDNYNSSNHFAKWDKTSTVGWGGQPSTEKEEGELQETPKEEPTSGWGTDNNKALDGWGTETDNNQPNW